MSIIQEIIHAWRRNAIELSPGASPGELEALRDLFHCAVPADVREFYASANGMPDNVYDDHEVSFWSISKICERRDDAAETVIGFADFLIESWRFMFSVEGDSVVVISENVTPGSAMERVGTFSEFLELYVTNPDALCIL